MLRSLPVAVIVLLLASSCSTYQYGTVSSSDMSMNGKQEFVYENDSIRLIYNFNGRNAPINITIQNKLPVPVYIDWQKSALIINDQAISYVPTEMKIEGGVHSSSYNSGNRGSGTDVRSATINATASLPPSIDFVPPQSYFTRNPMGLTDRFIENVPESAFQRLKYNVAEGYTMPVKAAVFTEGSSPIRFKSYLTLMVGETAARPVSFEHSFFISQLMSSGKAPSTIWLHRENRGNQFYISKTANSTAGVVIGFTLLTAVSVGLMADKISDTR